MTLEDKTERVWIVVGLLVAIFLIINIGSNLLNFGKDVLIPITGGGGEPDEVFPASPPLLSAPTLSNEHTATRTPTVETPEASESVPPSATHSPQEEEIISTDAASPTDQHIITSTAAAIVPIHGVMTPFGPNGQFIIHKVAPGESFTKIAAEYQTTIDVLHQLNYMIEGKSLWVDQLIVVLPGQTGIGDLPRFNVVVIEEETTLEVLAEESGASAYAIRYYNTLWESNIIPANLILIIPVD
jgi:LysM repeat protein